VILQFSRDRGDGRVTSCSACNRRRRLDQEGGAAPSPTSGTPFTNPDISGAALLIAYGKDEQIKLCGGNRLGKGGRGFFRNERDHHLAESR
jgi:hypothetical protein